MSYSSYRTSSAPSRGRGFSTRGSFRGRGGGGEGSNSSWNSTSPRGSRGGFSGPSRGRFNWYKEHSSSFDSRRSYGSGGFTGGAGASGGADRYSSRGGRAEDSYRRSYRGDVSDYSSRDHSHHRSPESQRKRMRTEHSYVQASSGRRSHEGSYGGGTDYNSRYSYEDKGYGEDRSRGYREERRSAGSFRDRSREEYPHRKADQLDSGMPPPSSGPPRHVSSPRGSFRGRASSRGPRGMSRLTLARDKWRTDPILARKRSVMDSYSVRKRILSSRAQADYLRRLKIQKLRRMRELAAKKEGKGDKDGKTADEISDGDEEEDGELGELEDWDTEVKKEGEDEDDDEVAEKIEEKPKIKKEKKVKTEEEREEGEEVDEEEEEAEEEEEDKEGDKADTPKKSESKNGGVHVTIKQDSDSRAVSEEVKRTTFHGKPFIRLTCPHCFMRCITFKEYSMHLYSSKHIIAMRKQSLQLKQTLARMRMTQRQKQRIVEENESAQGSLSSRTRFCPICKLNYRQFKTKHQISDYHRAMNIYIISHVQVKADVWRWTKTYQRRIHEHDVRALAVSGPRLLSGGVDGYLAVSSAYPKTCFKYPPLLQNPAIVVCREARCILLRYWTHLEVWKLGQNADDPHPVKLLVLESAGGDPITCAALSSNSRWLAYSTPVATRFFSFEHHVDGQAPLLQKVAGLPEEVGPSHHITFSPDSSLAIVATNSAELIILKLGEGDPMVLHSFQPLESKLLKDRIFLLEVSNNGKFLIAADHLSNICVWTLDNGKYFCSLPRYNSAPTALGTQPENDTLVIAYADHTVVEYSLESRKYTEFSQRLTKRRPRQWLNKAFPVIGVTFDPRNCDIIILYDDVTMHVINKTKDLPDSEAKIPRLDSSHSDSMDSYPFHPRVNDPQHALHVIKKYKHLVHLTWLMGDEVVAVEVSPAALDEQLPPILKKKRFGM